VIGEPSALRESIRTKTPRCSIRGIDLLDADRRDVELRQIDAQVRVAFVGADDDGAVSATAKLAPVIPASASRK
jgi:hypothetical protein